MLQRLTLTHVQITQGRGQLQGDVTCGVHFIVAGSIVFPRLLSDSYSLTLVKYSWKENPLNQGSIPVCNEGLRIRPSQMSPPGPALLEFPGQGQGLSEALLQEVGWAQLLCLSMRQRQMPCAWTRAGTPGDSYPSAVTKCHYRTSPFSVFLT